MLDYIIKVLLFQILFLAMYDIILKRETFFQWNRAYLIGSSFIPYIIPLLKIERIYEVIPQEYVVLLPEVMLSPTSIIEETIDWSSLLFAVLAYLFWIGVFIASLLFVKRLYEIVRLINTHEKEKEATYSLVKLESTNAFSFFKFIFLGKALSDEKKQQIIAHELVHVQQKHSLDLLFFEVQKIVCWFNPFSYWFQRRIAELHEFIADSKAIKEIDKKEYFQNLLAHTFGTQKISFINPFLKFSLIKKRIVMLNKHKSKQVFKVKYLLLIPVLVCMLFYSSCERKNSTIEEKLSDKELQKDYSSLEEVPFINATKVPVFPGCEDAKDQKQCFNLKLQQYATKNFNISLAKGLGLASGKKKIYTKFSIDKNGKIVDVESRATHKDLEIEAIRLVKSLPIMQAGENENGNKIVVTYMLPISFNIE